MGFVMDGLDTESYDRVYSDKQLVKRIGAYFRQYKTKMLILAFTLTLSSAASSAAPIIISQAINSVTKGITFQTTILLAIGATLIGSLGWLFNFIQQRMAAAIVGDVVLNIRSEVFEKTVNHDFSFFDAHISGKIVSRITSDTQDFSQVVTLVVDLISQFLIVGILAVWLFAVNPGLTGILLVMAPVAVLIALSFRKAARRVTRDSKKVNALINSQIQESISGIMVAKSFRREKSLFRRFADNNKKSYKVGIRRGLVFNMLFPVMSITAGIGTAIVAYTGGAAVINEAISPGNWYLFMLAVGFFWYPMLNIASFWSQFQDGLSAAERVFSLIDQEPAVKQKNDIKLSELKGRIEFNNLEFSYTDKEKIFTDFSLSISPGETIAIVGHTGAGKSSITRLISRFYEFQGGEIKIDNHNIRDLNLKAFRKHIGLVPQDPYLFSGTVRENIRYGRPDAGNNEVQKAAEHLGKGTWIDDLPNGLDTDAGHRGSLISMGQRQLVALARILLKDPAIFILDEATASVDLFTEVQIQESLSRIMKKRTTIVIAHRLSTIKNADRILVLDKGRIIEEGDHDELIKADSFYAELYNTYFRHQSMEYVEQFGVEKK